MIEEMIEWFPVERDRQRAHAREITLGIFPGAVDLRKHHLPLRPVDGPPAPDPALQCTELAVREDQVGPSPQRLEDRHRLESGGLDQERLDLRPDGREGIRACAIRARYRALTREGAYSVAPARGLAHPGSHRGGGQWCVCAKFHQQSPHLPVRDHTPSLGRAERVQDRRIGGAVSRSSSCRYPAILIVAEQHLAGDTRHSSGGLEMGVGRHPVFGLSQGNPPSGVAVWYCFVDAEALTGGPLLSRGLKNASGWLTSRGYYLERVGRLSDLLGFRGHVHEDIQTQTHRISQAISTSLKNPDLLPSSLSTKPKSTPHLDEAHPNSPTRGLHRDGAQECLMFVTGQA
jgi:hypothetical protein